MLDIAIANSLWFFLFHQYCTTKTLKNKTKDRLRVNYYRHKQDIQGSDDEAKCAIA